MAAYTIRVGQRLTDYSNVDVTVQRVASGGMGLVAMGPDSNHNRWSALKTMKPEALVRSPDLHDRFIREGLTWVGLWPHPNILTAQGVTEIDGLPFLVLDYAEHGSLADLLTHGRLTLASALLIAQYIAAGLVALHMPDPARLRPEPLVHRDLKPDNVLIHQLGQSQYAQITDFGLVALLPEVNGAPRMDDDVPVDATRSARFQTREGSVMGTVAYMAPEQWQGIVQASPPVDLYALGLILAQCITGNHPLLPLHQPHSLGQWRAAHERGMPQRLQAEVPEPLERLYLSLLAKRGEDRPTAAATLDALNAVAQRLSVPPYAPPEVVKHTSKNEKVYWHGWAVAYARFNLWSEALARNDRAVQLAPHHPKVLLSRGTILAGMQRWGEALTCYQTVLPAYSPEDHLGRKGVYHQMGMLHSEQGEYAAAEAAFAQALTEMPDAADTWLIRGINEYYWGSAKAQTGQRDAARMHLRRAREHAQWSLALNPADTGTPRLLAASEDALRQVG